jgi:hypothetical protein
MSMTEMRCVCRFQCDGAGHSLVLPRRSPLGIFVDEPCQPTGIWPIDFLCLPHGHVCQIGKETIRQDSVETLAPGLHAVSLWQIEYECAKQNCGRRQTIYTRHSPDAESSDVINIVLRASRIIACKEGHSAELRRDLMTVERLD